MVVLCKNLQEASIMVLCNYEQFAEKYSDYSRPRRLVQSWLGGGVYELVMHHARNPGRSPVSTG